MRVGSLFSGIGGIELGFELAGGFETAWFVEFDPYAQAVLRKNFPEVPIYGDIRTIDFQQAPPIDVLVGGFPCQDISNAGKRAGISGERSGLWKEFARAIRETKPKYVFIENVGALLNRGLSTVLQDLHSLGYDAEWNCFPASAVGAPHRRDRIMVLAYPHGKRHLHRQPEEHAGEGRKHALGNLATGSGKVHDSVLADSCGEGLQGQCEPERVQQAHSDNREHGWWATEPRICRVAHGVPNRVERIKCLGNAVVPFWAAVTAYRIKILEET